MDTFEKWIWIELIGFDNSLPDYGVKDYLDTCGFLPTGVSLLLTWIEFPLSHRGLDTERPLAPCECSYGAHPANSLRRRQTWTNFQLAGLIRTLQSYGMKVYLCIFNIPCYTDDNRQLITGEFCSQNQYLYEINRFGQSWGTVNVCKRLKDGSWFEDLLQEKVVTVLQDYGFDGIQIADGISSGRLSLQEGDYSDDIVQQFLQHTPLPNIPLHADGDGEKMLARATLIWQEHRAAWIEFHRCRWLRFFEKFAKRLADAGKEAIFNNAWTKDPFEAIYRYGVDYRAIGRLGFRGCMAEDVSAGLAILSQEDNGFLMTPRQREQIHYIFLSNLMLTRAAMPALRLTPLAGVHDMMEQWGVLEHMPTSMTRNVMCNINTLFWNGQTYTPIEDGPWFCLSDGITREQWQFILSNWRIGDPGTGIRPAGPAWVWSDRLLDAELQAFIHHRQAPGCYLLSRLLEAGAPVHAIVRMDDLAGYHGDLIVPNPGLLPPQEQALLQQYDRGQVYCIGDLGDLDNILLLREQNSFGSAAFARLHGEAAAVQTIHNPAEYTFDPRTGIEPAAAVFPHPLSYPPISDQFFHGAAEQISRDRGCPVLVRYADRCELICVQVSPTCWRVYIGNDDYYYNIPKVDMQRQILSVRRLTGYEGYPVAHDGSQFQCRIPPRGMEAFEVTVCQQQ